MFANRTPSADEALRAQQIADARQMADEEGAPRRTLHVVKPYSGHQTRPATRNASDSKRPPLKGHEAFLKALELSNADVVVEKCDAKIYKGKLKHSDKYTITLRTTNGDGSTTDRVIFKHDISEFHTTTAPRVVTADTNSTEGQSA
jgi:sRNA-binding regulator protein Hfq